MQRYELMLLFRPLLVEDIKGKFFPKVKSSIEQLGGKVDKIDIWGKRLLAYPIGKYKEGNYVVCNLKLDSANTPKLVRTLRFDDSVIKFLLINKE